MKNAVEHSTSVVFPDLVLTEFSDCQLKIASEYMLLTFLIELYVTQTISLYKSYYYSTFKIKKRFFLTIII